MKKNELKLEHSFTLKAFSTIEKVILKNKKLFYFFNCDSWHSK